MLSSYSSLFIFLPHPSKLYPPLSSPYPPLQSPLLSHPPPSGWPSPPPSFWRLHAFNFVSRLPSFEGRVDFTSLIGCCEFKVLQAFNLLPFPLARSMPLHPFLYDASLHRLAPLLCFRFWLWFSRLCEFIAECGSWSRGWETAGNPVACAPPHSCLCKGAPSSVCFLPLSM